MTNYEWLTKNEVAFKSVLLKGLAACKGKQTTCLDICCSDCDFDNNCQDKRREWLEAEHISQYKKGDVILNKQGGYLVYVVKDTGEDLVTVNNKDALENESRFALIIMEYNDVAGKVGNIYD